MLKAPDYLRDGAAIYERSCAIIRTEADLSRFSREEAEIAVRMIHACGQVEAAAAIEFAPGLVEAARAALRRGAPILCDAAMVAHGITRARLPAKNEVVCTLNDPSVKELAAKRARTNRGDSQGNAFSYMVRRWHLRCGCEVPPEYRADLANFDRSGYKGGGP